MLDLGQEPLGRWFAAIGGGGGGEVPDDVPAPPARPVERDPDVAARLADLGALLSAAALADPPGLSAALRADPLRADLQAVLAGLGLAAQLRVLTWPAEAGLPEAGAVAEALVSGPGEAAAALRAARAAAIAWATLRDLFAPERLEALRLATLDAATAEETAP